MKNDVTVAKLPPIRPVYFNITNATKIQRNILFHSVLKLYLYKEMVGDSSASTHRGCRGFGTRFASRIVKTVQLVSL